MKNPKEPEESGETQKKLTGMHSFRTLNNLESEELEHEKLENLEENPGAP